MFKLGPSNLQHTTSLSFLLVVYARLLQAAEKVVDCGGGVTAHPSTLINLAKSQVCLILKYDNLIYLSLRGIFKIIYINHSQVCVCVCVCFVIV